MQNLFSLIALLFQVSILTGQVTFDDSFAFTENVLNEINSREDIVGTAITIGLADSIVFSKGYGIVDRERGVTTQYYHKFRIYSLSKHIAAIAAAKLSQEGLLDLDKSIGEYIPFLDEKIHDVTTRQLIGHIGGIRSYKDEEWQEVSSRVCFTPFESILSFQSDSLLFLPGERYSYTSFGYVLLSAIIEKTSNKPFINHLNEELFNPLDLNFTLDNPEMADHLAAKPYEYWKGTMYNARYANNTCKFGGGGLSGSTRDVVLFNQALLNGKLIDKQTLEMVFTSMVLNNGEKTNYGFGLQFDTDKKGRKYAWHSGRSRGGRNALIIYPNEKLVVCISSNTNSDSIVEEAESIAASFIDEIHEK